MRGKLSTPVKAFVKSLALVGCAYVYGAPAFEPLRPAVIDGPFRQLHTSVNILLRDVRFDPEAPADAIVQTSNALKRQVSGTVNPN